MNTRPTVCFLVGTMDLFGGAERVTAVIANGLVQRGWRVHILSLCSDVSQFALDPAIRVEPLFTERPSFKTKYLATVRGIRRYVRAQGIDVLISVDTLLALFSLPACVGLPVRQIAWEHCHFDQDLGLRSRRLGRQLAARYFASVVVLTERDRAQWERGTRPAHPVQVIPNPLPFAMPELGPRERPTVVLAVGRLTRAKGFDLLLHAWQQVVAAAPAWTLRIVGEGECRADLEALRDRLGLHDAVSLPGTTHDIERQYREAGLYCLSSRYEGFGMVLIEAMAYGLPIVSTDCETGPRELLRDGANALLAPVEDGAALAGRILRLVADPQLGDRLAAVGAVTARGYARHAILERWERLLCGIGDASPQPVTAMR